MQTSAVLRWVDPVSHYNFLVSSGGNLFPMRFAGKLLFHTYANSQMCLFDLGKLWSPAKLSTTENTP
jgi:hypothetical protein